MKRFTARVLVSAVLLAGAACVVPGVASASNTRAVTTTSSTTTTQPAKFKRLSLAQYRFQREVINQTFKSAVLVAQSILQTALSQATNAAARSTARAAYVLALTEAAAARDAALSALGKPPTR